MVALGFKGAKDPGGVLHIVLPCVTNFTGLWNVNIVESRVRKIEPADLIFYHSFFLRGILPKNVQKLPLGCCVGKLKSASQLAAYSNFFFAQDITLLH